MPAILVTIITWALGGAIARMLTGAGLALIVYTQLSQLVEFALDQAVTFLSGMGGGALQLLLLFGVGDAIALIGSAMTTRAAMLAAATIVGLRSVS